MEMDSDKLIFRLKKQYNAIEIPDELNERVDSAMNGAGVHPGAGLRHGRGFMRALRGTAIGAAAIIAAFIGVVNVSPSAAQAMRDVPVLGQISEFLSFRSFDDEQYGVEAHLTIPEISGMENETAQINLNRAVNEYVDSLILLHNDDVATAKKAYIEDPELMEQSETAHISMTNICTVLTDNTEVFSMRLTTDIVMAGAQELYKCFTVDKRTGEVISLGELFRENSDYAEVLTGIVARQMGERAAQYEGVCYFTDEEGFEGVSKEQNFYITDAGTLVLCFDEYEIAPGYMGAQTFEIPTDEIAAILFGGLLK